MNLFTFPFLFEIMHYVSQIRFNVHLGLFYPKLLGEMQYCFLFNNHRLTILSAYIYLAINNLWIFESIVSFDIFACTYFTHFSIHLMNTNNIILLFFNFFTSLNIDFQKVHNNLQNTLSVDHNDVFGKKN